MKVLIKNKYINLSTVYAIDFTDEFSYVENMYPRSVPASINFNIYGAETYRVYKENIGVFAYNVKDTKIEPLVRLKKGEELPKHITQPVNNYIRVFNENLSMLSLYEREEIDEEEARLKEEFEKRQEKINSEWEELKEKVVNLWKDSKTLDKETLQEMSKDIVIL